MLQHRTAFGATIMILGTAVGCFSSGDSTYYETDSVGARVEVNKIGPYQAGDPEILIYYANETLDSANADKVVMAIKGGRAAQPLGQAIEDDKSKFRTVVAAEIQVLKTSLCGKGTTAVLMITNDLLRKGRYEFCPAGEASQVREVGSSASFKALKSAIGSAEHYQNHPALSKETLRWALNEAKTVLAAGKMNQTLVNLVIKSHGAQTLGKVVAAKVSIDWAKLSGNETERTKLVQSKAAQSWSRVQAFNKKYCVAEMTDKAGLDDVIPGLDSSTPGLDSSTPGLDSSTPGLDSSGLETLSDRSLGISNNEFLDILAASELRFLTVFTESCRSNWEKVISSYPGKSSLKIANLIGADKGEGLEPILAYENVKYQDFLLKLRSDQTFGDQLAVRLEDVMHAQRADLKAKMAACQAKQD